LVAASDPAYFARSNLLMRTKIEHQSLMST
jgi:hypothetical protein